MRYVIAPNGVYAQTVEGNYVADWSDTCTGAIDNLTEEERLTHDIFPLVELEKPDFEPLTQYLFESAPTYISSQWISQYSVEAYSEEHIAAQLASIEAARVASLWQAAHDKEYDAVSGSAVGLIVMGVLQGKPKCTAVQNWIKSLWSEYYTRKASGSNNLDFSIIGECPHTVPELMSELNI
jgi:hypothetical protein